MYPVSARFLEVVQESYTHVAKVEVTDSFGNVLADSDTLKVAGGTVQCDGAASIRRRISDLTLVDETGDLVPDDVDDLFNVVSGNLLRVYTGAVVDGVPELVPQGVFALEGATAADGPEGLTIGLSAYDLGRRVSRNRFLVPYVVEHGTNAIQAMQDILNDQAPWVTYAQLPGTNHQVPRSVWNAQSDPWRACHDIAESFGHEIFFNREGAIEIVPTPDPYAAGVAVANFAEGINSTLLRVLRAASNEEAFNVQVVTGENTYNNFPARGKAQDTDPNSPTYIYGPYGMVPEFTTSSLVLDDAQATEAAQARLNKRKGATEVIEFGAVPNAALDVADVVTVTRAKSGLAAASLVLDRFSVGLRAAGSGMSVTTRQRRLPA